MKRFLLSTFLIYVSVFNVTIISKKLKCGRNAVISKNRCECKYGYIGDPQEKCISYVEACQLNPCGPYSLCISNMSDPKVIKLGPYCICEVETHGVPPKCQKLCTFNLECYSHEYCNGDYCEDICSKDRCGPNSVCEGKNNEAHCSCVSGFVSEPGIGCRKKNLHQTVPQLDFNSTSFCSSFCGENADCEKRDEKISCNCNSTIYDASNPFKKCESFEVVDRFQIPSELCDCCSENLKPGCETPIDANLLKTLAG